MGARSVEDSPGVTMRLAVRIFRPGSLRLTPMRYDDPILDTIARSIYTFFPRCLKCGQTIESFEDADVRILTNRIVHRRPCPAKAEGTD